MKQVQQRRVALVTGGGKRLGKHIALALAENGYSIAIVYHTSKAGAAQTVKLITKKGSEAAAFRADVTKRNDVQSAVKKVVKKFGRIDLLVNNAGMFVECDFEDISETIWDTVLDTNLKSQFLFAQAVVPSMKKNGGGKIINIASLGGIQAWGKRHLPYSVSKAGVIMLTRSLAKALAPAITVNAIAPGIIEMDEPASTASQIPMENIPLKRYGDASDITNLVVYLAEVASYITGQTFTVDGGRSA